MFVRLSPKPLRSPLDAKAQITTWLLELFAQAEFQHAFLVELNVSPNAKVEIYVDSDEAVDLQLCRQISRFLEEKIDPSGLLPEKYTLEVSSPGTKRPMSIPRQFGKHIGRTLEVKVNAESNLNGQLVEVTDSGIVLTEEVVRRDERNKKVKETLRHELSFGSFESATVQISFK